MVSRPSQHDPGNEVPEKHWAYRFAKKHFFFGFGAGDGLRRRGIGNDLHRRNHLARCHPREIRQGRERHRLVDRVDPRDGGGVDYGDNFVGRYNAIDVALTGLGATWSLGHQLTDRLSWGIGGTVVQTQYQQTIAVNQGAAPDGRVAFRDLDDVGLQGVFGLQYEFTERLMFGATYRSEFDAKLEGNVKRDAAALAELGASGVPYVSVLTDPTTGGVSASLAMLGDVNVAEPGALIGFAGPRTIKATIRIELPEGFHSTTNFPTYVLHDGEAIPVEKREEPFVIVDNDPNRVLRRYFDLTGMPALPPRSRMGVSPASSL